MGAQWKNNRPKLTIESTGGANLGNCYNAHYHKVTSLHPLSVEDFAFLRKAGVVGHGQESYVHQVTKDGKKIPVPATLNWETTKSVEPTGHDKVECVEMNDRTGEVVSSPAINPYTKLPYEPSNEPYYVYHCEDRVDSSD